MFKFTLRELFMAFIVVSVMLAWLLDRVFTSKHGHPIPVNVIFSDPVPPLGK